MLYHSAARRQPITLVPVRYVAELLMHCELLTGMRDRVEPYLTGAQFFSNLLLHNHLPHILIDSCENFNILSEY